MTRIDLSTVRWLLPYFRGSRRYWLVAVIATIITSACEPLVPAMLKPLLDRGFTGKGIPLWMVPVALLLVFAVRGAAGFLADLALARITQDGLQALRKAMFARVLNGRLADGTPIGSSPAALKMLLGVALPGYWWWRQPVGRVPTKSLLLRQAGVALAADRKSVV